MPQCFPALSPAAWKPERPMRATVGVMVRGPIYLSRAPGRPRRPMTTSINEDMMIAPWIWNKEGQSLRVMSPATTTDISARPQVISYSSMTAGTVSRALPRGFSHSHFKGSCRNGLKTNLPAFSLRVRWTNPPVLKRAHFQSSPAGYCSTVSFNRQSPQKTFKRQSCWQKFWRNVVT